MKLITELDKEKWIDLMNNCEFKSPFQSYDYYKIFNSVNEFSAKAFAIEVEHRYLALIVVTIQKESGFKSFFSKRGIVYGGPLIRFSDSKYLDLLLQHVNDYFKKKLIYLEVRNNFDFSAYKEVMKKHGWLYIEHLNVQLSLENLDLETYLSGLKYNRRREIKMTNQHGAHVREAKSESDIVNLYKILKDLYKTRVKLPLQPLSFFIELYNSQIGKVFIVTNEDNIIGGSFCLYDQQDSIFTMSYAGLRDYHKKIFPTHLAIIGAIKFGFDNDLKMLDFMGAGKPNLDYGVRNYKLQFGGELVEHGRFKVIYKPILYKIGELGIKLISKLT